MPTRTGNAFHITYDGGGGLSQDAHDDAVKRPFQDSTNSLEKVPASAPKRKKKTTAPAAPPPGDRDVRVDVGPLHVPGSLRDVVGSGANHAPVVLEDDRARLFTDGAQGGVSSDNGICEKDATKDDEPGLHDILDACAMNDMPDGPPPSMKDAAQTIVVSEDLRRMMVPYREKGSSSVTKSFLERLKRTVAKSKGIVAMGYHRQLVWLFAEGFADKKDVPANAMTHRDRVHFMCMVFAEIKTSGAASLKLGSAFRSTARRARDAPSRIARSPPHERIHFVGRAVSNPTRRRSSLTSTPCSAG